MSKTAELYLDERLEDDLWIKGRGEPKLTVLEETAIKTVAEGLCISFSSLGWAYLDMRRGSDRGFQRLRKRLMSPSVKMVKG